MVGKLSIGYKILAAFMALLMIVAGVGAFAIHQLSEVNKLSAEMRTRWLPSSQMIGDIHAYTSQYRIAQGVHVAAADERGKRKAMIQLRNQRNAIDGLLSDFGKLAMSPQQKALYNDIKDKWARSATVNTQLVALSDANDPTALDLFNGEALDLFYGIEDDILQLIDQIGDGGDANSKASEAIYAHARKMMIYAIGGSLLFCVLLSLLMMRIVARPIRRMSEAVDQLVAGDLAVDVPGTGRGDELGQLARATERFKEVFAADKQRAIEEQDRARQTQLTIDAIGDGLSALTEGRLTFQVDETVDGPLARLHRDYNVAVEKLVETMSQIVDGCGVIRSGTSEIAQASQDLSRRTENQAQSLAHAAHTLGEFTGSVKIAADNARQTSQKLAVARASAESVDQTAKQAIQAMRNIEASSKEMNEIISTIDALAFQTNLLALNAGVEAARAGDAGAGFAVVASEVRLLAQRSSEAASRIRDLVVTSGGQIANGVSLVEHSGEALRQIVAEVTEIAGLVDEIAGASQSQATGLQEINEMVASMDTVTQQNAAMVEESTASSRNLSMETDRLFEQLSFFDLGRGHRPVARTSSFAPPPPAPRSAPVYASHGNAAVQVEDDWTEF